MDNITWKYKILLMVAVLLIGTLTIISVVFLMEFAVVGGDVMSVGKPQHAQAAILLTYSLSAGWLYFVSSIGTIALVASIFWDNIVDGTRWFVSKGKVALRATLEKQEPVEKKSSEKSGES